MASTLNKMLKLLKRIVGCEQQVYLLIWHLMNCQVALRVTVKLEATWESLLRLKYSSTETSDTSWSMGLVYTKSSTNPPQSKWCHHQYTVQTNSAALVWSYYCASNSCYFWNH